jgi:hypothetical protein
MLDKWHGGPRYDNTIQLKQRYLFYYLIDRVRIKFSDSLTFKPRKNSAPKPAVKFYDVKSKIFSKSAKKGSSEDLPDDDEDDSWLDEPQEVYDSVQELDAEKSSPINLASKYLTTFLAHTKDDSGINHDMSLHANKPKVAPVPASVQDDNDFSMEF